MNNRTTLVRVIAVSTLALLAQKSGAAVIFSSGSLTPLDFGANFSQEGTPYRIAGGFTLTSSATLEAVRFWGTHWNSGTLPNPDSFRVIVYGDSAGAPNTSNILLDTGGSIFSRIDTGYDHNDVPGANILEYSFALTSSVPLSAATPYWLAVIENGTTSGTQFAWQEVSSSTSGAWLSSDSGISYPTSRQQVLFELHDTAFGVSAIPEPGSATALAVLLTSSLSLHRRRKPKR